MIFQHLLTWHDLVWPIYGWASSYQPQTPPHVAARHQHNQNLRPWSRRMDQIMKHQQKTRRMRLDADLDTSLFRVGVDRFPLWRWCWVYALEFSWHGQWKTNTYTIRGVVPVLWNLIWKGSVSIKHQIGIFSNQTKTCWSIGVHHPWDGLIHDHERIPKIWKLIHTMPVSDGQHHHYLWCFKFLDG